MDIAKAVYYGMKNFFSFLFIAGIILSACYALGIMGDEHTAHADNKEYAVGGFAFSGRIKDGRFDGDSSLDFQNGGKYNGHFKDGRFNGGGIFSGPSDDWSFDGVFDNGKINKGTFYTANGVAVSYESMDNSLTGLWSYKGGMNERGQNGTGIFIYEDGSEYSGSFLRGLADGEGVYTDASGEIIYTGGFKGGLFEGQGIYHSPEGWIYEGHFKSGLFDGEGVFTTEHETIKGVWEKGVQIIRYED